jgi:hypothetical protein
MTTATVYRWVVDDVIAKIKPEVVQEGLDEYVFISMFGRHIA